MAREVIESEGEMGWGVLTFATFHAVRYCRLATVSWRWVTRRWLIARPPRRAPGAFGERKVLEGGGAPWFAKLMSPREREGSEK